MKPFISIITPSLQRESIVACCESVDGQSFKNWQHVVAIDGLELDDRIMEKIEHKQRRIMVCGVPHRNYGNTCRHNAWLLTGGEYVLYLDDDNTLMHKDVLKGIHEVIGESKAPFAVFPILRHGQKFFSVPPRSCHVDTANLVIRRDLARWPNRDEYTMDGIFYEQLAKAHPNFAAFPDFTPIVRMDKSSEGK